MFLSFLRTKHSPLLRNPMAAWWSDLEKKGNVFYYSPKRNVLPPDQRTPQKIGIIFSRQTHTNTHHGKIINNESIWGKFSLLKISNFTGFVCIFGCCHRKARKRQKCSRLERGKRLHNMVTKKFIATRSFSMKLWKWRIIFARFTLYCTNLCKSLAIRHKFRPCTILFT